MGFRLKRKREWLPWDEKNCMMRRLPFYLDTKTLSIFDVTGLIQYRCSSPSFLLSPLLSITSFFQMWSRDAPPFSSQIHIHFSFLLRQKWHWSNLRWNYLWRYYRRSFPHLHPNWSLIFLFRSRSIGCNQSIDRIKEKSEHHKEWTHVNGIIKKKKSFTNKDVVSYLVFHLQNSQHMDKFIWKVIQLNTSFISSFISHFQLETSWLY